jgi:LysR family transcriptional regulator, low CO2-responsive transcriptional regulator
MKNATLRQFRVFAATARHRSFSKAAEELHLTPPAVSMQIRELEEQVGLPLFDRSKRQVALTVTGEYLLVYAKKILSTLKDAEDAVARFRGLESGRVSIGMVSTAEYFVPRMLARFRHEHPAIEVKLAVGRNREDLVSMLQANDVDLAIMGRPPRELATRAEPFAVHPHAVVTAPDHPLTRIGHAPASLLNNYEFIIREPGSGTRAAMERYFADHRLQPRVAMEMASNETIKQAVIAGMGVSFLSLHTVGLERKAGLLAVPDIEGLPVLKRWYVVNTLAKTLSPPAEAFRYFVLEEGERFLASEYGATEALGEAHEPA